MLSEDYLPLPLPLLLALILTLTAMLSGDVDAAVASTLAARGFTAKNTLLAHR